MLVHRRRVLLDLHGHAVELDEEHRARALRVARPVGLLGSLDREAVHDLHRRREDPRRDDPRDGIPRGVDRGERRELRHDRLGLSHDPEGHLDGDPERPLGADDHPEQIRPVVAVDRRPSELEQLAVREHDLRSGDVVDREAVLEAVGAARVLRHVAADRADLLAGRIGCVEVAVRRDGPGHVEVRHARLHDDALALDVDLENPAHPGDRDDDPVRHGERTAGEAGARAAGDERHPVACAEPEDGLHVVRRAREHDAGGLGTPAGEAVAVVGREPLGLRDHELLAHRERDVLDEALGERHTARSYFRGGHRSMIDDRVIRLGSRHDRSHPASRQDRLRRAQLQGPRGGAGSRPSGGSAPLRQVHHRPDRARRPHRDPAGRDEVRLRGRARRRARRRP